MCWRCGWTEGLGWALLVPLTLFLPGQLVHQVGLACAVEAHDSYHHNRLPDGRQDLQGFRINQQSPISVLNEALWAWHVDLWGHVALSAREEMGWIKISSLNRSRAFIRLFTFRRKNHRVPPTWPKVVCQQWERWGKDFPPFRKLQKYNQSSSLKILIWQWLTASIQLPSWTKSSI